MDEAAETDKVHAPVVAGGQEKLRTRSGGRSVEDVSTSALEKWGGGARLWSCGHGGGICLRRCHGGGDAFVLGGPVELEAAIAHSIRPLVGYRYGFSQAVCTSCPQQLPANICQSAAARMVGRIAVGSAEGRS